LHPYWWKMIINFRTIFKIFILEKWLLFFICVWQFSCLKKKYKTTSVRSKTTITFWLNHITMGGGVFSTPLWFFLTNLITAYFRTLKLLHFFNIIVVYNLCKFFLMHRVGWRTVKRQVGVKKLLSYRAMTSISKNPLKMDMITCVIC